MSESIRRESPADREKIALRDFKRQPEDLQARQTLLREFLNTGRMTVEEVQEAAKYDKAASALFPDIENADDKYKLNQWGTKTQNFLSANIGEGKEFSAQEAKQVTVEINNALLKKFFDDYTSNENVSLPLDIDKELVSRALSVSKDIATHKLEAVDSIESLQALSDEIIDKIQSAKEVLEKEFYDWLHKIIDNLDAIIFAPEEAVVLPAVGEYFEWFEGIAGSMDQAGFEAAVKVLLKHKFPKNPLYDRDL